MKSRKKHKSDSHEFSLYWSKLSDVFSSLEIGQSLSIDDADLHHRIVRVLRLMRNEQFILFDSSFHVRVLFEVTIAKNSFQVTLLEKHENVRLQPTVIFFLPLLKRDALEAALYSLVELGASEIRLMRTQKTQRVWGGAKEFDRLRTIMIAAAEQSKQYIIPTLHEPQLFDEIVKELDGTSCLFFDPQGADLFPVLQKLRKNMPQTISLMIGPEADVTSDEKQLLQEHGAMFCRLTPTILRAQQAVAVSLGMVRSLVR